MAKIKSFVLHDESVNTRGFRMLTSGANLEEFIKNPVGLLNHNDWELPIIRWENIRKEGGKILADPVFDEKDPKAVEVMGKVDRDFVRMASIGAWPPEEVSDDPALKMSGQTLPTVTRWTVREASIVTIGANHNAICFYDRETGKPIDLTDPSTLIKLMDVPVGIKPNTQNMNPELLKLLNLADNATPGEVEAAMRLILSDHSRLKAENTTLTGRIDALSAKAKAEQAAEAILLVDAAVKDGRLNASARDETLKMFDENFERAKTIIGAIPARASVAAQIGSGGESNVAELSDLQKKDWDTLDKEGKLVLLKDKYVDLYKEKFKTRFGVEPQL
jgi:hypothetical protein